MIEGCPFLFQDTGGTVYHVNENGVNSIWSWPSKEYIVAFIDGDKKNYEPKKMICKRPVQIIMASSPKGTEGDWIKQEGGVTTLATELWSLRELFLTGFVLGLLLPTLD